MNLRRVPNPTGDRDGFSLLEVILALAILTGALAILGELARWGLENADHSRKLTQAQLLCESKMAELTAGLVLLEPVYRVPFEGGEEVLDTDADTINNPDATPWVYSIETTLLDDVALTEVVVTVEEDLPEVMDPARVSLVRWMIDEETLAAMQAESAEGEGEAAL